MNRIFTLSLLFILCAFVVNAQNYAQVSVGAAYAQQVYYTLDGDNVIALDNISWDLAFSTGPGGAGILCNESASLSAPISLAVFLAPTNDFANTIDPAALTDSLYNGEASWEDGALVSVKDETNPFDFGWGSYNPNTHIVMGDKVFAIRLRDDSWKKIKIESLSMGVYTMKYADLDGENEATITINKGDFADSPLALFSFDTGTATAAPANWDLFFGRYLTPLDAGGGVIVQYPVTGILSGPGVEVAEANGVDPATVDHQPYLDSLDARLDIIGSDWKSFNLNTFSWAIESERAYFLKLPDNNLWKLVFVDFEGSGTGTTTFEKTNLGVLTSAKVPESNFKEFGVFPNPVGAEFTVSFSLKERRTNMPLYLVNSLGQKVWERRIDANSNLNVFNFMRPSLPAGIYRIVAGQGADLMTDTIFIK